MPFDRSHPCERHYKAKLVLRWIALLLTIACIVLAALGRPFALLLFIPLAFSFIWNIANIARRLSARTPIHPGANVALDLITWLAFFCTLVYTYFASAAWLYLSTRNYSSLENACYNSNGSYYYGDCVNFDTEVNVLRSDSLHTSSIIALVAAVVGSVDLVIHFVLFVLACIDTHRVRHPQRYPDCNRHYEKVQQHDGPQPYGIVPVNNNVWQPTAYNPSHSYA